MFNITCDPESHLGCQNESLETIAAKVGKKNDVQINIKIPQLKLNAKVSFTNLSSLTINGTPGLTTIACKDDGKANPGIVMSDVVDKITLTNLNITLCGSLIYDIGKHGATYSSALIIDHCRIVELYGLVITRNRGLGLMLLNHQGGRVNIRSTYFGYNKLPPKYINNNETILGGGGIYIRLAHLPHIRNSCMTFQFDNCTFENNIAHTKHNKNFYTDTLGMADEGQGRGGGVYILLKSGLTDVNISFLGPVNFITVWAATQTNFS